MLCASNGLNIAGETCVANNEVKDDDEQEDDEEESFCSFFGPTIGPDFEQD